MSNASGGDYRVANLLQFVQNLPGNKLTLPNLQISIRKFERWRLKYFEKLTLFPLLFRLEIFHDFWIRTFISDNAGPSLQSDLGRHKNIRHRSAPPTLQSKLGRSDNNNNRQKQVLVIEICIYWRNIMCLYITF